MKCYKYWSSSDWKKYLDYEDSRCKFYGEFGEKIRMTIDPYWGLGISEEDEENLPEFNVCVKGEKTVECYGTLTIKAIDETQAEQIFKNRCWETDDIDWEDGDDYYATYSNIEFESVTKID